MQYINIIYELKYVVFILYILFINMYSVLLDISLYHGHLPTYMYICGNAL